MSDSPVKAQVGSDLPVLATPRSFGSNLNTSVSSLGEDGQADVEVTYPDGGWEAWGVVSTSAINLRDASGAYRPHRR